MHRKEAELPVVGATAELSSRQNVDGLPRRLSQTSSIFLAGPISSRRIRRCNSPRTPLEPQTRRSQHRLEGFGISTGPACSADRQVGRGPLRDRLCLWRWNLLSRGGNGRTKRSHRSRRPICPAPVPHFYCVDAHGRRSASRERQRQATRKLRKAEDSWC